MRVLIFGASGMLGHKLYQCLRPQFEVFATMRGNFESIKRFGIFDPLFIVENIEVTDSVAVRNAIETLRPDCVINAVGIIKQIPVYKDVLQTLSINSIFPQRLVKLSAESGFRLITISTDCVFDGKKGNYTEDDDPNADDLYGMSKLLGEVTAGNSLTIRTSLIGRELSTARSIVEWFLGNRGGTVKGYTNAIYSGFPTLVLADIISRLIADHPNLQGIYHISSEPVSKFHLLELLEQYYAVNINIEPSDEVVINRSLDSSRFRASTGFKPVKWPEMMEQMAADATPYENFRGATHA